MFSDMSLESLLFSFVALIPAFVLHELAHAVTAVRLGDPTPRLAGRLTLNPLKHLDLIGSLLLLTQGFGWARPVPINPRNFRDPQRDGALVAIAGPLTNLLLALVAAFVFVLLPRQGLAMSFTGQFLVINVALFVFNLLPIPPLDGARVLAGVLPRRQAAAFQELDRYGWAILLLVMVFGALDFVLRPLSSAVLWSLVRLAAAVAG